MRRDLVVDCVNSLAPADKMFCGAFVLFHGFRGYSPEFIPLEGSRELKLTVSSDAATFVRYPKQVQ